MRTILALGSVALLAACASDPAVTSRYTQEYEQLAMDCQDRGGVLQDLGERSGYPARDYACRIQDVNANSFRSEG